MNGETHGQLVSFIWDICNLLRGPYKRNEYRKVILPLTVLRRFECLLEPTRKKVLKTFESVKTKSESVQQARLRKVSGYPFYNLSKMQFTLAGDQLHSLLDDPNNLASNLNSYINAFSPNVRAIIERFKFGEEIIRMAEKNILFEVIKSFAGIDLSPQRVDQMQMGYVFEELIRIGAEQSNEEAGEHFTPREVIKLMVNLLLAPEKDLTKSHVVKTIYDPACGTGGMLSVSEEYIRQLNKEAKPKLFGQDWNDEAWAVCKSDMLIKGEDADNIILGDTFTEDGFKSGNAEGHPSRFDYMLANPPFGVEWKQQKGAISQEADTLGYDGRFGAGTPRINDGALLFLQHMISKMQLVDKGGSRIGIVFNGSPLFTGDAGSGESNIRRWIIEKDWLDAIVALPEQLFYNTGIATYVWVVTNRKAKRRKGKVQLIDARNFWVQMEKSLGNKRRRIGDSDDPNHPRDPNHIHSVTHVYENFTDGETCAFDIDGKEKVLVVSKIFDNDDFGYHKITVERPLRLNFQATEERIARLKVQTNFRKANNERKQVILDLLADFAEQHSSILFKNRQQFLATLREVEKARDVNLLVSERKAVLAALGERDESAEICVDKKGKPEPDEKLRDTEAVPLKDDIKVYFEREVLPHVPDAWIDHNKTKVGYEIPFNRHFYRYEPPRELTEIEAEIKELEGEILELLKEVTA